MVAAFIVLIGLLHPLVHLASAQDQCQTPDSQIGQCINIRRCKPLLNLLLTQGVSTGPYLRASRCGFDGNDPMVCCAVGGGGNSDDSRGNQEVQSTSYGPLSPPDCGFSNITHGRVVGGVPAKLDAWPWLTALGYRNTKNPLQPKWLCGGSLISRRHVLTAAHCVFDRNDLYIVRLGELVLNDDSDGANPIDILIDRKTIHPKYSSVNYVNDIAVLRLQGEVEFTAHIHPICLPVAEPLRSEDFVRTFPFIAGWGSVRYKGPSSPALLELQIPVIETGTCKSAFTRFSNAIIDERILCAGYSQGGKDACQGDSGGPLMFPQKRFFYAIGVVSYGYQCATPGYPGVYTKTSRFLDFITSNLV